MKIHWMISRCLNSMKVCKKAEKPALPQITVKFLVFCLVLVYSSVNAGVYRWTDNNGNVHYSDQPVEQSQATELDIDTESRAGITNSAGNNRERDLVLEEIEEERQARKKSREEKRLAKKQKQKRCARAKDDLRRYQTASAVYKLDKKGERVFYSKEERASREKKFRQLINKHCR